MFGRHTQSPRTIVAPLVARAVRGVGLPGIRMHLRLREWAWHMNEIVRTCEINSYTCRITHTTKHAGVHQCTSRR